MTAIDWTLFAAFLAYVVWDGTRRARAARDADDYFLAGRAMPWWAIGLSVMATQASAITMIGTTGQGWHEGMRFIQFYLALPLAMIILAYTAVPLYHRLQVSTAYEYLGIRFDGKTRILSAFLFLVLRGLSVGFVIYTPSLVLAKVFNLPLAPMILFMGGVAVVYTSLGGLEAVIRTDVKQMSVMILGLVVALVFLVAKMPHGVGLTDAVGLAAEAGRLKMIDLSWDPSEKYTLWSSLLGATFLFLAYFGADQSQVQRLLAGRSIRDTRRALFMNAVLKIPFQFLVLFIGVLLFAFYTLEGTPATFEPAAGAAAARDPEYRARVAEHQANEQKLRAVAARIAGGECDAAVTAEYRSRLERRANLRAEVHRLRGSKGDVNYVFLDFILNRLPIGIVGLLLAAIFAAALSSIDSEINAMTTVVVLDVIQFARRAPLTGRKLLWFSRLATLAMGALATTFALYLDVKGSLVEAVNKVGSYIYGPLLGVFILALAVPRARGHGAFIGLITGVAAVAWAAIEEWPFLYLNTLGVAVVLAAGGVVTLFTSRPPTDRSASP
jgi:Na+/proline symporter